MVEWVTGAENALVMMSPVSRVPATIRQQLQEHQSFLDLAQTQLAAMTELSNRGLKGNGVSTSSSYSQTPIRSLQCK